MRALFYSLILVSFAASASTSPFTGTWILKSREVKATSGDCAQSMTIKANRDSLKISTTRQMRSLTSVISLITATTDA